MEGPMAAMDLLEEHDISAEGVTSVAEAQKKLRQHLKKMKDPPATGGVSVEVVDELENDDIEAALSLMEKLKLDTGGVEDVSDAQKALRQHLRSLQEDATHIEVMSANDEGVRL